MSTFLQIVPKYGEEMEQEVDSYEVRDGCLVAVVEQDGVRHRLFMPLENLLYFAHIVPGPRQGA